MSGPASASYVYDPIGRLVQTTVNGTVTRFLYDGVNLVAEYNGLGAIQRRYMHTLGTDQPWVQFTGSAVGASNARYLYGDYHGSIIALADSTGVVANADIYKYGTYGEPLDINNNLSFSGSRFRYTGQTVLPEASLYYYKARVYDPVFGRFLQTDPIGSKDDLDLYAYVGGDPVNATDPTGNGKFKWIVETVKGVWKKVGSDRMAKSAREAGKNVRSVTGKGDSRKARSLEQKVSGKKTMDRHDAHGGKSKNPHYQPDPRGKGKKGMGHTIYTTVISAGTASALNQAADEIGTWEDKLPSDADQYEKNRAGLYDFFDPASNVADVLRLGADGINYLNNGSSDEGDDE